MKLVPRQALFVKEYLVDLNATQAAIRAGYSKKTADVQGPRLLGNAKVKSAVEKAMNERAESIGRTAKDVVLDIIRLSKTAEDAGQFNVAMKGLELEGKHYGAFTEKVEINGGKDAIKHEHSISPMVQEIVQSLAQNVTILPEKGITL